MNHFSSFPGASMKSPIVLSSTAGELSSAGSCPEGFDRRLEIDSRRRVHGLLPSVMVRRAPVRCGLGEAARGSRTRSFGGARRWPTPRPIRSHALPPTGPGWAAESSCYRRLSVVKQGDHNGTFPAAGSILRGLGGSEPWFTRGSHIDERLVL